MCMCSLARARAVLRDGVVLSFAIGLLVRFIFPAGRVLAFAAVSIAIASRSLGAVGVAFRAANAAGWFRAFANSFALLVVT